MRPDAAGQDGRGSEAPSAARAAAVSAVAWAVARRSAPVAARALRRAGKVRTSWKGDAVPTAVGLVPAAIGLAATAALGGFGAALVPAAASAAGWLDDTLGGPDRRVRGWAGHLRAAFRERRITSGTLKAAIVGLAAAGRALATARDVGAARAALGALSAALTANAINQLDTRPGRAAQAFLLGMAGLAMAGEPGRRHRLRIWLPLAAAVAGYLPVDRAGRAMLGDTGANALGAALGTAAAEVLSRTRLLRWVLLVAALNAAGDLISLSALTDRLERGLRGRGGPSILCPATSPPARGPAAALHG